MKTFFLIAAPFIFIFFAERTIRNPDFAFWLFLNLYFDPGGIVRFLFGYNIIGPVDSSDLFFFAMCAAYILKRMRVRLNTGGDIYFKKFLLLWGIFTFYYITVYGGLLPILDMEGSFFFFLVKRRSFLYAVIMLPMTYFFSLREKGLEYFYKITLFFGVISLSMYLVTLLTGFEILPVKKMIRYHGSELQRYSLHSFGYFKNLFPLGIIVYILKKRISFRIPYKLFLYFAAGSVAFSLLVTLTRRLYIEVAFLVFVSMIFIPFLFKLSSFKSIVETVSISIIFIIAMALIFPAFTANIGRIYKDVFSIMTTGEDTEGQEDYRLTGEGPLLKAKEMIKRNFIFGTGFNYTYFGKFKSEEYPSEAYLAGDAASEISIYSVFFNFGLLGFLLASLIYIYLVNILVKFVNLFRRQNVDFIKGGIYSFLFAILAMLTVIGKFTFRFFAVYDDFDVGKAAGRLVMLGIFFALFYKYSLQIGSRLRPRSVPETTGVVND